jgi:hypothetical protein
LACLSLGLFLFKRVDQFYGGEEADLASVMFDVLIFTQTRAGFFTEK